MGGRRLTAILAADIAGYSALMGANEVDTLAALKGHQSAIFPLIGVYDGRIIDTAGDGILAEFASVYNAVKCAIAIQEIMTERNASVAPDRRMQFRIGINQGDVLFDENSRIFGDGINVAARLELICEPGSICISRKVYEEVKHRFEIHYRDIGEQTLKNIAEPVHAYLIKVSGTASSAAPATDPRPLAAPRSVLPRLCSDSRRSCGAGDRSRRGAVEPRLALRLDNARGTARRSPCRRSSATCRRQATQRSGGLLGRPPSQGLCRGTESAWRLAYARMGELAGGRGESAGTMSDALRRGVRARRC